jgi:hypothetical protein
METNLTLKEFVERREDLQNTLTKIIDQEIRVFQTRTSVKITEVIVNLVDISTLSVQERNIVTSVHIQTNV